MNELVEILWGVFPHGEISPRSRGIMSGRLERSSDGRTTLLMFNESITCNENETLHIIYNMKVTNEARSEAEDSSRKPE